jgi:Tol biopolymer transport system component
MDNPVGSDSLGEVWIYDIDTKSTARLTFNGGELPRWSPDGLHVAYRNNDGLYWIKSDGTGGSVKLTNGSNQFPMSFTPDGRALVFQQTVTSKNDILLVRIPDGPVSQPVKPEVVVQGPFDERQPAISPDGKWLAYASDDTGDYQVYVRPFPNVNGGKWQISAEGGLLYPTWSRSENRLFFRNTGNQLLSSTYLVQNGAFVAQPPTLWSEQRVADLGLAGAQNFDLAPDGRRVAAIMPAPGPTGDARRHTVVLLDNFVDELQRRVPQR